MWQPTGGIMTKRIRSLVKRKGRQVVQNIRPTVRSLGFALGATTLLIAPAEAAALSASFDIRQTDGRTPQIVIQFDEGGADLLGRVAAVLDGYDVTSAITAAGDGALAITPNTPTPPGTHEVTLYLLDADGSGYSVIGTFQFTTQDA